MQHLRDLPIRVNLYGGFGAVLVLLLAVTAAGLWSAQSMFAAANRIGTGTDPRIRAAVAEESSASTQEVSASTEESSASAEQIAASAHELSGNAERLSQLVGRFTVGS